MSQNLERALLSLDRAFRPQTKGLAREIDPRAKLLVALTFLIAMLSTPLMDLGRVAAWGIPIMVTAYISRADYFSLVGYSLLLLPFVALIGLFDILYEREVVASLFGIAVTKGWIMALAITLRGIFSVQTILLMVFTTGIYPLCGAMLKLRIPTLFVAQTLMIYRFLRILLIELQEIIFATQARSAGIKRYPLRLWARIISELLIRTIRRARTLDMAMRSRGWQGDVPLARQQYVWRWRDTLFLFAWLGVVAVVRFIRL